MAISYRPATPADSYPMFEVFHYALAEVDRRLGSADALDAEDPVVREQEWLRRKPIFEHLEATADLAWVAVDDDGTVRGYARSILRDGDRELTDFFVHPAFQGRGVGGELLGRAFPPDGADHRSIVATLEAPALTRYLRAGLWPTTLLGDFVGTPTSALLPTDLEIEAIGDATAAIPALAVVDRAILGHGRDPDHRWLLAGRQGFSYLRGGEVVGYGYVGTQSGPFAVLDPADQPAVLAHAESVAAEAGQEHFALFVPLTNAVAVGHLLSRGYRLDPFIATYFCDGPPPRFTSYVVTDPPFFI